jgi:membrane protease YdiL (CAAX protease family)
MKPKKTLTIFLLVITGFLAYSVLNLYFKTIKTELDTITHQGLTSYILTYFLIGIPIFIATYFINRKVNFFENLGLSKNILTGIGTGVLFALPMFAGGLIFFKFNQQMNIENLIAGTIVAGFMEELYFRGFLFGQLFRNTKIGFVPAIFLGAFIFAFGHLNQSQDASELTGIFLVTFFGAIFFAWLFAEWKYNLWVSIFTHTFMNLSWSLFAFDDTALGGTTANIFRALTIIIAIGFTIIYKNRNNQEFVINKQTWVWKKT